MLVDEKGEALAEEEISRRRKRSSGLDNVYYKLVIGGEEVIVELFLNNDFISPNLVIENRNKNYRTRKIIGDYFPGSLRMEKVKIRCVL